MNRARLRLGRHSRIGQSYILTTVTQERRCYFDDATAAQEVMDVFRSIDAEGLTHSLAYVVMPDHIHWLVEIRAFSLDHIMQRFKSSSALRINRMLVGQDDSGNRAITITPFVLKNHCFAMRCTSSPTRSGRTWRAAWGIIRMPGADGRSM
jgi:REP element-mobilizing transposase RayT